MAFYGTGLGALYGSLILAVEDRLTVGVLANGGMLLTRPFPEIDAINFVPRIKALLLMINGRYDYLFPFDTSQIPHYRLLGTPDEDKRHVVFDTGHGGYPQNDVNREIFDWLDRYLGPVK